MTFETRPLPANPNLTQLKRQAKDLQRAVRAGDPDATDRVRAFHPGIDLPAPQFSLRDAQVTLAREYGFDGWYQLTTEVGERMVDERDLHRWFGVQLNNGMWDRIEDESFGPDSPLLERELMLYSAFASAYHWRTVGTMANAARGEHLIARMAVKVGEHDLALRHARRCLGLVEAHPGEMEAWDEPFAREALARALAATGDRAAASEQRHLAEQQTAALEDADDRAVLEGELDRQPWFGLL